MAAGLPGKGGEALLFLSAPERRIRSQMFLSLENIFTITWRRLPPPRPAPHTIPPPQLLGISSPKPPAFTRNPPFSFLLQEKRQGHLPESLALSSATLGLP